MLLSKLKKVMASKVSSLFDEQFKLERISKLRDPLEKLNDAVDWELPVVRLETKLKIDVVPP